MNVNPGELRHKIVIVKQGKPQVDENGKPILDADGFPIEDVEPTVVRRCNASFSRTSGTELIKAGKEVADVKCRFLVRSSNTEITRDMTVQYNGNNYNVKYVNDYNDSKEYTEIWCEVV